MNLWLCGPTKSEDQFQYHSLPCVLLVASYFLQLYLAERQKIKQIETSSKTERKTNRF
jgi:hypothetical protein